MRSLFVDADKVARVVRQICCSLPVVDNWEEWRACVDRFAGSGEFVLEQIRIARYQLQLRKPVRRRNCLSPVNKQTDNVALGAITRNEYRHASLSDHWG
jgi:hypothetical protein